MAKHSHRPSSLKQVNKPFKGKKRARKIRNHEGSGESTTSASPAVQKKVCRFLIAKQKRKKRLETFHSRLLSGAESFNAVPPRIVMLLSLSPNVDPLKVKHMLLNATETKIESNESEPVTFGLPNWCRPSTSVERSQQRLTVIDVNPYKGVSEPIPCDATDQDKTLLWNTESLFHALDMAKVASIIVVLLSGSDCTCDNPPFDALGYELLSSLRLQGMPETVGIFVPDEKFQKLSSVKKKEKEKLFRRFFISEFGNDRKLMTIETNEQVKNLMRVLVNVTPKEFSWRGEARGYMMTERIQLNRHINGSRLSKLTAEGFVRGVGFSVKHPIHITGIGDVVLESIEEMSWVKNTGSFVPTTKFYQILTPEIEAQLEEEWKPLRPYDPFAAEQTWPTVDELDGTPREQQYAKTGSIPAKFSIEYDDHEKSRIQDADTEMNEEDQVFQDESVIDSEEESHSDIKELHIENSDLDVNHLCRRKNDVFTLEKRSREDMEFPDEIDMDPNEPARERLGLYRGLKSFRSSVWDPYEELPHEYSRIHEFDSFNACVKHGKQLFQRNCIEAGNGASMTGKYVRMQLRLSEEDASEEAKVELLDAYLRKNNSEKCPLILSSLLPYERKVTICNLVLHRRSEYRDPVPSKDPVYIQCGLRRFMVRPLYAQLGFRSSSTLAPHKSVKLKYERFFHPNSTVLASFYSPTVYPGAPVMVFGFGHNDVKADAVSDTLCLPDNCAILAWGTIIPPEPLRVIVKRVVLTGYPFRVHKRKAVIRYMFFNPQDIRWFKPVELCTKKGFRGHIKESLGTHGYMKCVFNEPISQDDTVCMYLYKRVFPKWFSRSWGDICSRPFNDMVVEDADVECNERVPTCLPT